MTNPEALTNAELIEGALSAEGEERWAFIHTLHRRGSEEILSLALPLTSSPDPVRRILGAEILGQLGAGEPTFLRASVSQLLVMLDDAEPEVLAAVATALGHRGDPSAIPALAELKSHESEEVRYGVAFGLACHEDELAISTLIELTGDSSDMVRDWATFAIASQSAADSEAIRAALLARVNDPDENIRAEAIIGLARRGHADCAKLVLKEFSRGIISSLLLEAAEIIADPALYPPLQLLADDLAHLDDFELRDALKEALEACSPSESDART